MTPIEKEQLVRQEFIESAGKSDALSSKGARGPMQIIPTEDFGYGIGEITEAMTDDPRQNRELGEQIMNKLMEHFGSYEDALVAYNWGSGNAKRWIEEGRDPAGLPDETRDYVEKITGNSPVPEKIYANWDTQSNPPIPTLRPEEGAVAPTQEGASEVDLYGVITSSLEAEPKSGNDDLYGLISNSVGDYDPYDLDNLPNNKKVLDAFRKWFVTDELRNYAGTSLESKLPGNVNLKDVDAILNDDEAAAEWMKWYLRNVTGDEIVSYNEIDRVKNSSPEQKKAFAEIYDYWGKVPLLSDGWESIGENLLIGLKSPSSIASIITGGLAGIGAKTALSGAVRAALGGALIDAASNAAIDNTLQEGEIAIDRREEKDYGQMALQGLIGGAVSAAPGAVGGVFGHAITPKADPVLNGPRGTMTGEIGENMEEVITSVNPVEAVRKATASAAENPEVQKVFNGKYVGNTNLSRIVSTEDVKRLLVEESPAGEKASEAWVPKYQTHEETEALAVRLGLGDESAVNPDIIKNMSPEGTVRLRSMQIETAEHFVALSKQVESLKARGLTREAPEMIDALAARNQMGAVHKLLTAQTKATARNAGRILNAYNIEASSALARGTYINQILELTDGNFEEASKAVLTAIESGNAGAVGKAMQVDEGLLKKSADAVYEYWVNAILSAPDTMMVNTLGGVFVNVVRNMFEVPVAAAIGKLTKGESAPTGSQALARNKFFLHSLGDAGRVFGSFFKRENPAIKLQEELDALIKSGAPKAKIDKVQNLLREVQLTGRNDMAEEGMAHGAIPGLAGQFIRIPGRMMKATDAFNKLMARRGALGALGSKRATEKGFIPGTREYDDFIKNFINTPTKADLDIALREALEATFQNENALVKSFEGMRRVPGTRYVMPFVRTPINLIAWGVNRLPLLGQYMGREAIKQGKISAEEVLARQVAGGILFTAGVVSAMEGYVTTQGPSDYKVGKGVEQAGIKPFAVDGKASVSRMDPFAWPYVLGAGAVGMYENLGEKGGVKNDSLTEQVGSFVSELGSLFSIMVVEKSHLEGMAKLLEGFKDGTSLVPLVNNIMGGFVPNVVNRINTGFVDDYKRLKSPAFIKGGVEQAQSRIPGASSSLPHEYDRLGARRRQDTHIPFSGVAIASKPTFPELDSSDEGTDANHQQLLEAFATLRVPVKDNVKQLYGVALEGWEISRVQQLQGWITKTVVQDALPSAIIDLQGDPAKLTQLRKELVSVETKAQKEAVGLFLMELEDLNPIRQKELLKSMGQEEYDKVVLPWMKEDRNMYGISPTGMDR